jgi:D-aminopeptidase
VLIEGQFWTQGSPFDDIFDAVTEATEEASLNALCQADSVTGRNGHRLHALPIDEVLAILGSSGAA